MPPTDRRSFLKLTGAAAGAALLPASLVQAREQDPGSFDNATAKLYDATRCIGCRSCMRACRQANALMPEVRELDGISFDVPTDLGPENFMAIQLCVQEADSESGPPDRWSFFKRNCMHCNVPACASVCPVAALRKAASGPVVYEESRCIGCRYCMLACPYGVPRYEWVNRVPRVRKCNFSLACVHACPVGALKTGRRGDLIDEAHQRILEQPERYVDHLYGEHEGGGASYLILSGIPFDVLGLPRLSDAARSSYAEAILGSLPGWIIGLGLFLGGLYHMERRGRGAPALTPGDAP